MITAGKPESNGKEVIMAFSRYYTIMYLMGQRKTMKTSLRITNVVAET
jgi:hypothetical protein